ncbi:MAG: cell division protein FtsW [Clostridia bacterium]|nr:cell division protein FtsW [Clostridia bacterium]
MAGGVPIPMPRRGSGSRQSAGNKKRRRFFNLATGFDMHFFVLLMIVLVIGLATLYSASHVYAFEYDGDSFFYIRKQLLFAAAGLVGMLLVSMVDYHQLHRFAVLIWGLSIVLLIVALFMPSKTGIHRWIYIAGVSFQPSELAKFALVLLFAHIISLNHKKMKKFLTGFLPLFGILCITCALVIIEPHLSGTMLIAMLGFVMMYIGGVRIGYLLGVLGAGAALVLVMVVVLGYEQDRIAVWLHPLESFANEITFADGVSGRDHAWQTVQSLYAIGSGGVLGQGPGGSRQKHLFLPEPQNDFIFAIFCEEMGLVGAVIVLVLFALLVWRGLTIALKAPDKFGCMLALGLTLQIGLQVAINVAVVTNLLPNTGISLPFFSYGGTSILMLMLQMGVVLSISRQSRMEKI